MEIRQLHYFLTVAEELHFGNAAKRLNMTQPPLSQQIQQLEEELDVLLFKRTKRRVELTDSGKVFYKGVVHTFEQLNEAIESAKRAERGEFGKLMIGFVGSATYDILPPLIRSYRNQFPHVEVKLRELSTPDQINELNHQKLDIGFVRPPIQSDSIVTESIYETPCIVALPKQHALAEQDKIQVEQLQDQPFVVVSRHIWPGLYDNVVFMCRQAGFSPDIKQEATEFQTVMGLVAAGIGIAIVPASLKNFIIKDVIYKEIDQMNLTVEMAIAYQKERVSKEIRDFIEMIRSITHSNEQ